MLHWISSTYSKRLLIWKDEQETGGDPGGPTRKQNETVAGDWKRPVKALVGCYRPLAQPEGHWLGGMRLNNKQLMIELAMPVAFMLMAAYVIVKALSMGSEGVFPNHVRRSAFDLCGVSAGPDADEARGGGKAGGSQSAAGGSDPVDFAGLRVPVKKRSAMRSTHFCLCAW